MCYVGKATKIFIFLVTVLVVTGLLLGFGLLRRRILHHSNSHDNNCSPSDSSSCLQSPVVFPNSPTPNPTPVSSSNPPLPDQNPGSNFSPPPPPSDQNPGSNLSPPPPPPPEQNPGSDVSPSPPPPPLPEQSPDSNLSPPPPPVATTAPPPAFRSSGVVPVAPGPVHS